MIMLGKNSEASFVFNLLEFGVFCFRQRQRANSLKRLFYVQR